jgi:hypothetical protein
MSTAQIRAPQTVALPLLQRSSGHADSLRACAYIYRSIVWGAEPSFHMLAAALIFGLVDGIYVYMTPHLYLCLPGTPRRRVAQRASTTRTTTATVRTSYAPRRRAPWLAIFLLTRGYRVLTMLRLVLQRLR